MNTADAATIALRFNACINAQDLAGLADLMADDHAFIDRTGTVHAPKRTMLQEWQKFFELFPHYRNTFTRVESRGSVAVMAGNAYWSEEQPRDPAIWVATIENGLVREWRIYEDTEANRRLFGLLQ